MAELETLAEQLVAGAADAERCPHLAREGPGLCRCTSPGAPWPGELVSCFELQLFCLAGPGGHRRCVFHPEGPKVPPT